MVIFICEIRRLIDDRQDDVFMGFACALFSCEEKDRFFIVAFDFFRVERSECRGVLLQFKLSACCMLL